jgi:hypothetical protein
LDEELKCWANCVPAFVSIREVDTEGSEEENEESYKQHGETRVPLACITEAGEDEDSFTEATATEIPGLYPVKCNIRIVITCYDDDEDEQGTYVKLICESLGMAHSYSASDNLLPYFVLYVSKKWKKLT